MYRGGSTAKKLGRGGGGGGRGGAAAAAKQRIRSSPSNHTPSPAAGRLSLVGTASRNRHTPTTAPIPKAATTTTPEETFDIVSDRNPLAFAMIIRLTPNLVDEIRRIEAEGGNTRIKFDTHAHNPAGNVIDVGGKDFRFTWSHEPGDLCDIYEERQSGEKGKGLLVESGGAWRKLNVQRILDESTKNHVKMRSEEAERKLKSRKAIVLEQGNPSTKTLAAAAVDVNTRWKGYKQKNEQQTFKKRKVEPTQVSIEGPPKSSFKPGLSSTATTKSRPSVSPLPSPPEQSGASASPFGIGNFTRGQTFVDEIITPQPTSKKGIVNSQKEMSNKAVHTTLPEGNKKSSGASPMDLQSVLVNLLSKNPKGMSLKDLEKATGNTIPNSSKKIEPIIKKVAIFQAPGRYVLRPGVELDSLKKPSSESTPEDVLDQMFKDTNEEEFELQTQISPIIGEAKKVEKIDSQQNSPGLFGDKKASDHSQGRAFSSSDSGSDSDSGSGSESDSGSDSGSQSRSRSRSKSKSPAGSASGSSSDSESDGSSSNKEGSDEDVDIMSGDEEKEEIDQKLQNIEPVISNSAVPWRSDSQPERNGFTADRHDSEVYMENEQESPPIDVGDSEMVEIINPTPIDVIMRSSPETRLFSPDQTQHGESQQLTFAGSAINERQNTKDGSALEHSDSSEKTSKSKMSSDGRYSNEKSENAKRKLGSLAQGLASGRGKDTVVTLSPYYLSPDRPDQDPFKDRTLQKTHGSGMRGRPVSDVKPSGERYEEFHAQALDVMDGSRKYVENPDREISNSERNNILDEPDGSAIRIYGHDRETNNEDDYAYEKSLNKSIRLGASVDRTSIPPKPQFRKQKDQTGNAKDGALLTQSHTGADTRNDVEKSEIVNGKGSILRRELSDLELGEFREPMYGKKNLGIKKFEKKNSFRKLEGISNSSDNPNSDSNKERTGKMPQDSRKQASPEHRVGIPSVKENSRKRLAEDDIEESTRPYQRIMPSQEPKLARMEHTEPEVGFQLNKLSDVDGKSRKNESRTSQEIGLESYGGSSKKASSMNVSQQGAKSDGRAVGSKSTRETISQKSSTGTDDFLTESSNSDQKRRESSLDEEDHYSKYEKDEPELKGSIKDYSQYKEYLGEYQEKYSCYCSLNKKLEAYRSDFTNFGRELQLAKRDREGYERVAQKVKDRYYECEKRHKKLKNIFIVLHQELMNLKQRIKDFSLTYNVD